MRLWGAFGMILKKTLILINLTQATNDVIVWWCFVLELTLHNSVNLISRIFRQLQSKHFLSRPIMVAKFLLIDCYLPHPQEFVSISRDLVRAQSVPSCCICQYLKETCKPVLQLTKCVVSFLLHPFIYSFLYPYTIRLVFRLIFPTMPWSVFWLTTKVCSAISRKTKPLTF